MSDTHAADAVVEDTGAAQDIAAGEGDAQLEGRARRMGWRPKEEFRGDPERWSDAKTFVERGENELPVLKERYRTLDDKFARQAAEMHGVKTELGEFKTKFDETRQVLTEFREESRRSAEQAYLRGKAETEMRMAAAVQTADTEAYRQARAELDVIEQSRPAPVQQRQVEPAAAAAAVQATQAQQVLDPVIQEWLGANNWFNVDPAMKQYATAIHESLARERPGLSLRDNLAEVRADVMQRFPEKFANPRRAAPGTVAAPGAAAKAKTGKTYDDLPAQAKAVCDKYVKQINATNPKKPYSREEYVATYFAGDEQ